MHVNETRHENMYIKNKMKSASNKITDYGTN